MFWGKKRNITKHVFEKRNIAKHVFLGIKYTLLLYEQKSKKKRENYMYPPLNCLMFRFTIVFTFGRAVDQSRVKYKDFETFVKRAWSRFDQTFDV